MILARGVMRIAHREAVEGHDTFDHGGLLRVEDSGAHALAHKQANFVLRDLDLGFGFDAEEGEQRDRSSDPAELTSGAPTSDNLCIGPAERAGDALGIAETDALGTSSPMHEGEIGEDEHDDDEGGFVGIGCQPRDILEQGGKREFGEGSAAKRRGDDADRG